MKYAVFLTFILSILIDAQGSKEHGILERPSLEEVEILLQSNGYSIHEVCQSHEYAKPSADFRILGEASFPAEEELQGDIWYYITNSGLAFLCVTVAALAAGLTMGLVSQDVLDLRIKEIAGDADEKRYAKSLLPLMADHHRLLVTLLLINAIANEALPLFLDKVVSPLIAVILSVTMVLFFGEIIPSAIFSGSQKLAITSSLAPLVRVILFVLYPIAKPIGKMLDYVLHEDEIVGILQKYDRKELAALVKLQFEERRTITEANETSGPHSEVRASVRMGTTRRAKANRFIKDIDTVTMVQGALEMQSTTVSDVMIKLKNVYSIPQDTILDEGNIVDVYTRGFSRVPVYDNDTQNIVGIFKSRQLMVINAEEERSVSSLPLIKPYCVSPSMAIQQLVNILQEGMTGNKGGHMALVCLDPATANEAMNNDEPIPKSANVVGIVTLENCIEVLIQEEIYDEYDKAEKLEMKRAQIVADRWKKFVQKKRASRNQPSTTTLTDFASLVLDAVKSQSDDNERDDLSEDPDGDNDTDNHDDDDLSINESFDADERTQLISSTQKQCDPLEYVV